MQNNKHSGRFGRLLREKGYYIVLALCVLAVGVSGYLYLNRDKLPTAAGETMAQSETAQPSQPQDDAAQQDGQPDRAAAAVQPEQDVDAAALPQTEPQTGGFTISMPVEGDVAQGYAMDHLSYNATTQDWRVHDGIDILAGAGAQVMAAADGTVSSVYEDDDLGTTVTVSHENGYLTRYSNLDAAVNVSVGDTVAQGDVLGTVGASARLEVGQEPHLHFALFCNAVSCDPTEYFAW